VLLDTCRKLELISDTTYKKLKHILDMRNDIGISHPTNYNINAFELLGWLQTCVQDVLHDQPTEAALQVQAFISNLKGYTAALDQTTKLNMERGFAELPSHLCGSLLRTVFGIYVAPDTDPGVRKNIAILAPALWKTCPDEPRYRLGIVLEGYNTNLYKDKYTLGEQFFGLVGGNAYRSVSERVVIVDTLITELIDKHNGWDNFPRGTRSRRLVVLYSGSSLYLRQPRGPSFQDGPAVPDRKGRFLQQRRLARRQALL
jgi:hypothetical protein